MCGAIRALQPIANQQLVQTKEEEGQGVAGVATHGESDLENQIFSIPTLTEDRSAHRHFHLSLPRPSPTRHATSPVAYAKHDEPEYQVMPYVMQPHAIPPPSYTQDTSSLRAQRYAAAATYTQEAPYVQQASWFQEAGYFQQTAYTQQTVYTRETAYTEQYAAPQDPRYLAAHEPFPPYIAHPTWVPVRGDWRANASSQLVVRNKIVQPKPRLQPYAFRRLAAWTSD